MRIADVVEKVFQVRTFKNGTNVINKLLPDFWSVCSAADIAVCYEPVCKFLLRLNCRSVHQFVGINDNQMCTNCLLKPDEQDQETCLEV